MDNLYLIIGLIINHIIGVFVFIWWFTKWNDEDEMSLKDLIIFILCGSLWSIVLFVKFFNPTEDNTPIIWRRK